MFNGYMALGGDDVLDVGEVFELMNSGRVEAYMDNWNKLQRQNGSERCLSAIQPCDQCNSVDEIFTNGRGYFLPQSDPAPWYDPAVDDSEKFFGVLGLEVTGAEDSTRSATVQPSVVGGGAVSRLRFGARTIVVRGLAVAADSCGLEVGLNWLRFQYGTEVNECGSDYLWFLDCCPDCDVDEDEPPVGPCWPETYAEMKGPWTIECDDAWVPTTYGDLRDGPPDNDPLPGGSGWCAWASIYRDLDTGLPAFACNLQDCLVPYIRNFQQVRVTEGPTILDRYNLSDGSSVAEIEFTIACGDPTEYTPTAPLIPGVAAFDGGEAVVEVDDEGGMLLAVSEPNPFRQTSKRPVPRGPSNKLDLPPMWDRVEYQLERDRRTRLPYLVPSVLVYAEEEASGPVRVGVWQDGDLVSGFTIPFVPQGGVVRHDSKAREVITDYQGDVTRNRAWARDFTGEKTAPFMELRNGESYTLTVDQEQGAAVPLIVEIGLAEKGVA